MTTRFRDIEELCSHDGTSSITPSSRVIVVLGDNADSTRAASFMTRQVQMPEFKQKYGNVEIIAAADVPHALTVWKESGFHPVAGFFAAEPDYKSLKIVVDKVDTARFSPVQTLNGSILLGSRLEVALSGYAARLIQNPPHVPESLEEAVSHYAESLKKAIGISFIPELVAGWSQSYAPAEKRLINRSIVEPAKRAPKKVSPQELQNILARIETLSLQAPVPDSSRRIPINDPRSVNTEFGDLLTRLVDAEGTVTRFKRHATTGVTGLFPPDTVFAPGEEAYFLKVHPSIEDAEALFERHAEFRRRGIEVKHHPLLVHKLKDGTCVVLSKAPILTMSGDIARILRTEDPEAADSFVSQKMARGVDRVVQYKNAVGMKPDETQIARILRDYKCKLLTAWSDMHMASTPDLTHSDADLAARKSRYLGALGLLDYRMDLWNRLLFGSVMDWKVYNEGQVTGILNPTAEQLKPFLGREFEGLLEYEGRRGNVLEDFFHSANSPEFCLTPQRKLDYYQRLLSRLLNPTLDKPLEEQVASNLWHPYFVMESFKSTRKAQRTLHYMASSEPQSYVGDLEHYLNQMVAFPWVAFMFFSEPLSKGTDFKKQITLVRQLYEAKDQVGKIDRVPEDTNVRRWFDWLCSNAYLASLKLDVRNLEHLAVTR